MLFRSRLLQTLSAHPKDSVMLSNGEGIELSAEEALQEVSDLACFFKSLQASGIALALDNSPAWVIADLAILESQLWSLPLPPFFTPDQKRNALSESGCSHIISDIPPTCGAATSQINVGGKLLYISPVEAHKAPVVIQPSTAKITFTSGSTAEPKGICLSEQNMLDTAQSVANRMSGLDIEQHVSVLPLAVLLENVAGVYAALLVGVPCVVPSLRASGIACQPVADMAKLCHLLARHPHHSCILVPELLKGVCQTIAKVPPAISTHSRFIAVGGARVGSGLLASARACNLPVFEGYGLSEACSVVSLNTPSYRLENSVGRLLGHQNAFVAEDGELWLKKPGFLGYCGDSAAAPANFATGDLAEIDERGFITLSGRKKNTLITSMGRNVSPEWIESELSAEPSIHQVLVHCDDEVQLCALVVSDQSDNRIESDIQRLNKRLPSYARIAQWFRVSAFSPADGTLTGNGKIRREAIIQRYKRSVLQAQQKIA